MTTTGRVVAMASYPTYDPSVWTNGISASEFSALFGPADGEPILNRAAQGEYAPGSTWKVTTTTAAVNAGYSLYSDYDCPASVDVGGRVFNNDFGNGGVMSLHQALVLSCDSIFYNFGYDIWLRDDRKADDVTSPKAPVQEMQKTELEWGFGQGTGVDLPAESIGTVPTREWLYYFWKDNAHAGQDWCKYGRANGSYVQQIEYEDCTTGNVWEPGQAVDAAIGQGYVSVTPLQLARAYVALANGGTLYAPRIGEELLSPDGKVAQRINPPVVGHLPASASTLAYIRSALAGVVTSGTAAGAFGGFPLGKVCVAGKTGTAQVAGKLATSVFASFAPCGDPKYVVVMMIPDSGYGADVSAPAIRQIWDSLYGLEGHPAALPGGQLPALPTMNAAGRSSRRRPPPRPERSGIHDIIARPAGPAQAVGRRSAACRLPRAGPGPPVRPRQRSRWLPPGPGRPAAARVRPALAAAPPGLDPAPRHAGAEPDRHAAHLGGHRAGPHLPAEAAAQYRHRPGPDGLREHAGLPPAAAVRPDRVRGILPGPAGRADAARLGGERRALLDLAAGRVPDRAI